MAQQCSNCNKKEGFASKGFGGSLFIEIEGRTLCPICAEAFIDESTSKIIMTTTNSIDGSTVSQYFGIESVEIVMGTGMFSEFGGEISDLFGARSSAFEMKLRKAKVLAFKRLKFLAYERGANAIIGY